MGMIELKCQNCGSVDIRLSNNIVICNHCGCKFILENLDYSKMDYLVAKAKVAIEEKKYKVMNDCALKILAIDDRNAYGWLLRMYYYGVKGTAEYADQFQEMGEKALACRDVDPKPQETEREVARSFLGWGASAGKLAASRARWAQKQTAQINEADKEGHPNEISRSYLPGYYEEEQEVYDIAERFLLAVSIDALRNNPNLAEEYRTAAHDFSEMVRERLLDEPRIIDEEEQSRRLAAAAELRDRLEDLI